MMFYMSTCFLGLESHYMLNLILDHFYNEHGGAGHGYVISGFLYC